MNAEELLRAGKLSEALARLNESVRANPADTQLRVFLFQLQSVLGNWDKALNQLNVIESMNPETLMLSRIFAPVVACEALRSEVFQGRRTPLLFGEPTEWMGLLIQANSLAAQGKYDAAEKLRDQAFGEAPASPGQVDGEAFEWIADADPRLGPMLEVILEGKYYWVPFCRVSKIVMDKPSDLRDLVWKPATFVWTNGGEAAAHIPTRYPGSEASPDDAIRLARKTEWQEAGGGYTIGLGQRLFATDVGEKPLLECCKIELTNPA